VFEGELLDPTFGGISAALVNDTTDDLLFIYNVLNLLNVGVAFSIRDLDNEGFADDIVVEVLTTNTSGQNLTVDCRILWNTAYGPPSDAAFTTFTSAPNEDIYVNNQIQFQERSFSPPPTSAEIRDNICDPTKIFSFFMSGFGLTPPDQLIVASEFNYEQSGQLFDYVHLNGPFYPLVVDDDDDQVVTTANNQLLLYWNNRAMGPSSTLSFRTAMGVTRYERIPETGQALDTAAQDFLDDDPFVSEPVHVSPGGVTRGIDIITNDGPERFDPPGVSTVITDPDEPFPPVDPRPSDEVPGFDDGNQDGFTLPIDDYFAFGAAIGDVNNDGFNDIFLAIGARSELTTQDGAGLANRLYLNVPDTFLGGRRFVDVTFGDDGLIETADDRVPRQGVASFHANMADFDQDGDIDIYVSNFAEAVGDFTDVLGAPNRLLINQGFAQGGQIGFFEDESDSLLPGILNQNPVGVPYAGGGGPASVILNEGFVGSAGGFQFDVTTRSAVDDIDGDGDIDIVVSNANVFTDPIGTPGILGATIFDDPSDDNPLGYIQTNLLFSERILINKLIDRDPFSGNLTASHGTFTFVDETLGINTVLNPADSNFGNTFGGTGQNLDRMPPLFPDDPRNNGDDHNFGNNELDASVSNQVVIGPIDFEGTSPDLYVANTRPTGAGTDSGFFIGTSQLAGQDMIYSNYDVGADFVADGFFGLISAGADTIQTVTVDNVDFIVPTLIVDIGNDLVVSENDASAPIGFFDGFADDAADPENDFTPRRLNNTRQIALIDPFYDGAYRPIFTQFYTPNPSFENGPAYIEMADGSSTGASRANPFNGNIIGGQSDRYVTDGFIGFQERDGGASFAGFSEADEFSGILGRPRGIAVADFNLDGDMDVVTSTDTRTTVGLGTIVVTAANGVLQYHDNDSYGRFAEVRSVLTNEEVNGGNAISGTNPWGYLEAADFDNDGDPDLLALTNGQGVHVFLNSTVNAASVDPLSDADFPMFKDETANYLEPYFSAVISPPLPESNPNITTSADFADVDGDGLFDLAIGRGSVLTIGGDQNDAYINNGAVIPNTGQRIFKRSLAGHPNKRLANAFVGAGGTQRRPTSWIRYADLTGDGAPDLFEANYDSRNQLYINVDSDELDTNSNPDDDDVADGVFVNRSEPPRLPAFEEASAELTFGFAFGDFTEDGLIDIFLANGPDVQNILLVNGRPFDAPNEEGGQFANATPLLPGLLDDTRAVATSDFNGDGFLDVFVLNRYQVDTFGGASIVTKPRSRLLLGDGTGRFTDATAGPDGIFDTGDDLLPLITGQVTSIIVADFDLQGDPTEDLNGNRILESNELEFIARNNSIDRFVLPDETEDEDGNGILTSAEDLNGNGILDDGEDTDGNGILTSAEDVGVLLPPFHPNNPTDQTVLFGAGNGILDQFDLDGNGLFDNRNNVFRPSYDVYITRADGSDVLLLNRNDGTGGFNDVSATNLPTLADISNSADVGNITLRTLSITAASADNPAVLFAGERPLLDIIIGTTEQNRTNNSASLLVTDRNNPGTFIDRGTEIPIVTSTSLFNGRVDENGDFVVDEFGRIIQDPEIVTGNVRVVRLADTDNDGDLDVFMGQQGAFATVQIGATDWFLTNRVISRNQQAQIAAGDQPGVPQLPELIQVLPPNMKPGEIDNITVIGRNFTNGTRLNLGDGTTVLDYEVVQPNYIIARVRVSSNAEIGPRTVTALQRQGGGVTRSGLFFVGSTPGDAAAGPDWTQYE
jgi:hypothetical protein